MTTQPDAAARLPAGDLLLSLTLDIAAVHDVGATPTGAKRVALIAGGRFEGARLRGEVCAGGGDWILARADGVRQLDARLVLKTDDGAVISMRYQGYGQKPSDAQAGQGVADVFCTAVFFETADPRYLWLNEVLAIGIGERRPPSGPGYKIYAVANP